MVSDNIVGQNAICAGNDPDPSDRNVVAGKNTCGERSTLAKKEEGGLRAALSVSISLPARGNDG